MKKMKLKSMKKKPQSPSLRRLMFESLERRELLASLQLVPNWGASGVPSTLSMYQYVPDHVAANPPILVVCHYWGAKASDVFAETVGSGIVATADQYGFIMVYPQTSNADGTGRGWDANSTASLTHNGGGETQGIAEMVQYAINTYHADPDRVYVTGTSSGAMMTEALLATYPDVFKAGAEFAGVPAGAWAAGNSTAGGWSVQAAAGQVTNTAQGWGNIARAMDPSYSGPRPRVQLWHGESDTTINYNNQTEAIKQWTNVLGLSTTPTSTSTVTIGTNQYTEQVWQDSSGNTLLDAWSEINGPHGTDANFDATYVIPFLGLDKVGSGRISSAQDADVGSPSPAGSSSYNAYTDTYTVAGGGADIAGTSDQFHYLSNSFVGNGSIIARVLAVQNTNAAAKAGVMFRDSTAAGAMYADMVVTAGQGLAFQWRSSTGASSGSTLVTSITAPAWVKLVRSGNSFTAFYATTSGTPTAADWIQVGSAQTIAMSSTAQAGLAVTSHSNGTLCTSTFSGVQLGALGTFSTSLDIGSPSPAGSASYDAATDTYTVAGGGADIWGSSDQFNYLSKGMTGDGVILARVSWVENTNTWSKAGPMFRDGTAAGAMFANIVATPGSGISFQWRSSTGGSCGNTVVTGIATPAWVKLVRSGSSFSAFYATTTGTPAASDWIQAGTAQTIAMSSAAQAGLAVTGHNNGTSCTATFASVAVDQTPTVATAAKASSSPVTGASTALSVLGADYAGESNLSYTWTTTGTPPAPVSFSVNGTNAAKATTATFTKSGTYNFLVTITNKAGLSTTSSVSVAVNLTLTSIVVAPATANLVSGSKQQFTATGYDQFGNVLATQPTFTWSLASGVGSVNSSGLYTATAGGSGVVQATSGGISATASVSVTNAAPTVAKPATAPGSLVTATTVALSVLGADDGGEANLTYTWSVAGTPPGPVSFSANGTNAAKNVTATLTDAGNYNFLVTITDQGGLSNASYVSVPVSFGPFSDSVDIGSPTLAGSLSFNMSSAAYTLKAGGANIGGTSDQFRYTYSSYSGNGQLVARVTSVSNTNSAAKAGVMFRDSTAANAAYALVWVSPSNQVTFETRSANGVAASYTTTVSPGGSPVWVRLVRSGNQFTASYSLNGTSWTTAGTAQTVTMATSALAGLAVTSHNTGSLNTSVIDNVALSGLAMRGRPTLNAARTTFIADNGQLLRGAFTSTEWTGAVPEADLAMMKNMGFNAVHLYGESFDINYPSSGSTAPGYAASRIDQIVQAAQDLGLYVVLTIGNGANNGNYNRAYIEDFWKFYAPRYANYTNVLFEVQNEPVAWGPPYSSSTATPTGAVDMEVSAYNIIRTYAPKTPVLLFTYAVFGGTGGASAALTDIHAFNQAVFGNANAVWTNEAVAFHGYNGAQGTAIAVQSLLSAGYPAFMTEYDSSAWGASNGGFDLPMTVSLEQLHVSWTTFQHVPPTGVAGDITDRTLYINRIVNSGLSWTPDYGNFPAVRGSYGNGGLPWTTTSTFTSNQLTGTLHVEAENYDSGGEGISYHDTTPGNQGGQYRPGDGVDIATSTDINGGFAVSSTASGEWFEYTINVQQSGYYNLGLRYANATSGAAVDVFAQGVDVTEQLAIPTTGSLSTWSTLTSQVYLGYGQQIVRIYVSAGGAALNWFELTPIVAGAIPNGTYLLVNRNSGQAMQFNTANSAVVQQSPAASSNLQQWTLQNLGAGQYRVYSVYNGNNWNGSGGSGTALGTTGYWGTGVLGSQQFLLRPNGDGYYTVTAVTNGLSLDVLNSSTTAGASIVQNVFTGQASQEWLLISTSDQLFPSGLTASRDSSGNAQLSWTAASGAAGYNVKRATTSGGPYTTIATSVTAAGYVDTSVSTSTTYYYVVSAVSSAGKESLNSSEVSLTPPRALLKFDETSGTSAADATGHGWTGTLQGGATWSSGVFGNAVSLNGSNQYVTLPTGVVNGLTDFTISTWVNLTANPSWARIFDFGTGTSNYMFLCANPNSSNALRFAINTGSGEQLINGTALTLGTWTQVAVTMAGGVGTLYINGQAVGTNASMTINPSSLGATNQNYIGRSQFSDPYFNGKIDDFRIYASGLSSGEIASLYQTEFTPTVATAAAATPATVTGTTTQLSVLGTDSGGESGLTYTWSLVGGTTSGSTAPVTFSANGTNAAKTTTATFSQAGTYNFLVSIANASGYIASSSVAVTVNQMASGISVTPSTTPVSVNATKQFTATAVDQFGVALAAQPTFTWTMASGGGSVSSSGLYTAPATAGSATVQAASGSLSGSASVTVTAQSAPTVATAASASPSPAGTSATLSVRGASTAGESTLTYTWSLTGTPPAAVSFSANGTNGAKSTTATFTASGTYNFTVTITDQLGLTVTSSVSVSVNFGIFTGNGDIGSPTPAGSLSYNATSGAYTVTAGGADIWGTSDQFNYSYASFSGDGQITVRVASVSNSNAWAKAGPMFRDGTSAGGAFANVVATPGNGVSFQWRSTAGGSCSNAQITGITAPVWLRLTRAGNQFNAYYSTNGTSWTQIGTAQTVTMPTAALAGLAVTSHSQGTSTTAVMDHMSLNVVPSIATAASASPLVVAGKYAQLAVLGADAAGETNLSYTWSMTSGPAAVSYSPNGTNAAKSTLATFTKAGSYTFQVTIANAAGATTTSSVSVTVNLSPSTISVTPATTSIVSGKPRQFTATAYDQFGAALSPQPALTWWVASGGGSIDANGLYTASAAASATTVLATCPTAGGSASVTVTNAAPTVVAPAAATPIPSGGMTTTFSALGADDAGESLLTYTWSMTSGPAAVVFSANGTNAAKNSVATFSKVGSYTFTVTIADAGGLTTTSSIAVYVNQTMSSLSVSPAASPAGGIIMQNSGTATVSAAAGSDKIAAALHLASDTTIDAAASSTLTVTGPIDGSAGLTKIGGGKLVLAAANSFAGPLAVQSGTVVVTSASGLRDGSDLTIGAASVFNSPAITPASTISRGVTTQSGDSSVISLPTSTVRWTLSGVHMNDGMTFDLPAGDTVTFAGVIDGYGWLTLAGGANFELAAANTFVGGLAVQSTGFVLVTSADGISDGSDLAIGETDVFGSPSGAASSPSILSPAATVAVADSAADSTPASFAPKTLSPHAVAAVMAAELPVPSWFRRAAANRASDLGPFAISRPLLEQELLK